MDIVAICREVEERYRRYLRTTFYFRDPALRASFEVALHSGHLSKGPYLEATAVFKRTETPRTLFPSLLGSTASEEFLQAVNPDRPLYQHQRDAIQQVMKGRNVVVATGTASGKTEAFVYPILLHLFREFQGGSFGPGVRALVLYPMNALANDQRERLGEMCSGLKDANSPFQFTFGQYIGETPEDEADSHRHARDHLSSRLPGELVLRSEMRRSPPHILLTNYSMLEYLLLRPKDSPLFDGGQSRWWTFVVLDEVHQYRGSRGIEMAMLLRRLKRRLREGGRSGPFQCIATSATLIGGEQDRLAVARFASDLFGEPFDEEGIILASTEQVPQTTSQRLSPSSYSDLKEALETNDVEAWQRILRIARSVGLPERPQKDPRKMLAEILRHDARATRLRELLTRQPEVIHELAEKLFDDLPSEKRVPVLADLVHLLVQSKDPTTGGPLLSARYHLFLRSLEGAFVAYWPEKAVFLDRKARSAEQAIFEVALCRECGQHYFVARKDFRSGRFPEAIRDPSDLGFGATFLRPLEDENDDVRSQGSIVGREFFYLCMRCGEMARNSPGCGHDTLLRVLREEPPRDEDRADQMMECSVCGYRAAGRDPVREVVHGADGPNAVIATTLYQRLPEERKKVLAFADGRQEAAFFAWYLEDSYKDILHRNLLLKAAQSLAPYAPTGLSLSDLATPLRDLFRERRVLPPAAGELQLRRHAWTALYREFLTAEPRISLEGVGLVRWFVQWPDWIGVCATLRKAPWSLTEQESRDALLILLDSLRTDRAIELRTDAGVSLSWDDLELGTSQMRVRIGPPRGAPGVRSWDGETGRRGQFLTKLLMTSGRGNSRNEVLRLAVTALREIWQNLRETDDRANSRHRLLVAVGDARRLSPDWWRLAVIPSDGTIYQCRTCGRLHTLSVRGLCPRPRCSGTLDEVRVQDLAPNHYRLLYEEDLPGSLRVEEHTAQLDKEKAREFQREFRKGIIHVLSCSTTFELGVDLGDLDTIFLRNVPPEAFNYAQRVGRAGRRLGYPGLAITYCRRAPHDLYHFSEPQLMLRGRVRPPTLGLKNEKIITRHVTAAALSYFFQASPERFETVTRLFGDMKHASAIHDFAAYLNAHRDRIEDALAAIVPADMAVPVGIADHRWITRITGEESRFALAQVEVSSDYRTATNLEQTAAARGDYALAQWARVRAKTIAEEDVLSFLSRKAVIPKYGFPVDVVELDTQRTQKTQEAFEILLQRDLSIAISEFAPTARLVANKRLWVSYGLKRVAEKEWPRKLYKRCPRHNIFLQWEHGQPEPPTPCGDRLVVSEYVVPRFGFVSSRDKPQAPTGRPARLFTTRPYFMYATGPDSEPIRLPKKSGAALISLMKASPGWMAVLCEGRRAGGFLVCRACGAGFRKRERTHKTPHGLDCGGTLDQVSLGHEFLTDVLRLKFHAPRGSDLDPVWFAFGLAYALVEGASEVLEVPSTDLSATVAYVTGEDPIPPIVLYDNVPGGAGLVARLETEDILEACLDAARKRVGGGCGCDEHASCYGCLRSYRNQFAHANLQRGPVRRYLERLTSLWISPAS